MNFNIIVSKYEKSSITILSNAKFHSEKITKTFFIVFYKIFIYNLNNVSSIYDL